MSFDEKIMALSQRVPKIKDHLHTEEATKNALVMPFIDALGYDIFSPKEVVPEFTADFGLKKGEKVDYVIMKDGEPCILIECKKYGSDLTLENLSQLYRYFSVTKSRISILTNGTQYRFYSDLDEANKMDEKPFLEFDLERPKEQTITAVKRMAKDGFDLEHMLSSASVLKCTSEIKKIMAIEFETPCEELVRFFYKKTSAKGMFTTVIKDLYTTLVTRAFQEFINDKIDDRLRSALEREGVVSLKKQEEETPGELLTCSPPENGIITTEEELEGFRIVVAICSKKVSPDRVAQRDSKTYMGILLDNNNRKTICRLWFNAKQRYLGVFDVSNVSEEKSGISSAETRIPISKTTDIYLHAEKILATLDFHENLKPHKGK